MDTANISQSDWNEWLGTFSIGGMGKAKEEADYHGMLQCGGKKNGRDTRMGAVAVGCNVVLNSHIDQDFFVSMVSTHMEQDHYTDDLVGSCSIVGCNIRSTRVASKLACLWRG